MEVYLLQEIKRLEEEIRNIRSVNSRFMHDTKKELSVLNEQVQLRKQLHSSDCKN